MKMMKPLIAALALVCSAPLCAQQYPTKPIRLIVPFPPGGSNDIVGRMIAHELSGRLGQQVVIDNRGGAGGMIGTETAVVLAMPDIRNRFEAEGAEAVSMSSAQFGKFIRSETVKWSKVVREAKIEAQ